MAEVHEFRAPVGVELERIAAMTDVLAADVALVALRIQDIAGDEWLRLVGKLNEASSHARWAGQAVTDVRNELLPPASAGETGGRTDG